jgi:tetratricopeptide (TPR) repeat protein
MEKEEKIIMGQLGNELFPEENPKKSDSIDKKQEQLPEKLIVEKIFKDPEAIFNDGMNLLGQEQFKQAIKCFDEAIELNPQHADTWFYKGEAHEKCDEFETAIKCFDEAIRLRKL